MMTANPNDIAGELAMIDAEFPNAQGLPAVNIVAVPHSGSRSVAEYMKSKGYHPRLIHLQRHYHTVDFIRNILLTEYCVLAIRDPLAVLLSTDARQDDGTESVFANLDSLFSLTWPSDVFAVDKDEVPAKYKTAGKQLTDIGSFGNYPGKQYYKMPDVALMRSIAPWWNDLAAREAEYRPRLEALGYTNLAWWT